MSEKRKKKSRIITAILKRNHSETLPEDQVHLHDFLGMKPGVYLTILYAIALLTALFFILIFPGISHPGALVTLKTEPAGAALRVDGLYRGTAPDRVFVSQGTHAMELTLPGFTPVRLTCEIPGRLFASLIFPKRFTLEAVLISPDPAAALTDAARDYAAWTFGGEPTAAWQIPLSLSEGAYRTAGACDREFIDNILAASARFGVTRAAARDLIRAKTLADNRGLSPSPLSVCDSAADILRFLSDRPGAAQWLGGLLQNTPGSGIAASAWYSKEPVPAAEMPRTDSDDRAARPPAQSLNLGGLWYTGVSGGQLEQNAPFPRIRRVNGFMICASEVTQAAYGTFLKENPRWAPEQKSVLVSQGLVSGEYLIDDKPAASGGISAISWYAAQAYCQWLSNRLPPSMADYEVRLPTEAEWEYAVTAASPNPALLDNLWEWCADPFAPLDFFPAPASALSLVGSTERSLRSRINLSDPATRASLPPAFCSSFVSFRPVIALKTRD